MVAASWVEPMSTIQSGRAKTTMPSSRTACATQSVPPRCRGGAASAGRARPCVLSVVDTALDEPELDGGEEDNDQHQDHRLGGGHAEVEVHPPVHIGAVDQRLGL